MDSFKDALKENKLIIIALILIIIVMIMVGIMNDKKEQEIMNGRNETKQEDISYEKKNYKVNEYQIMNMSEFDVFQDYYKDFITTLVDNPDEAYYKLSIDSRNEYTKEEFIEYAKKIKTIFTKNNEIKEQRRKKQGSRVIYEIIDSEENSFTIIETAVWDYQVTINGKY